VVITDTFGRPWREGVVDVAIGCAGLPPLSDLRGTVDDGGRELETTVVAFADAVAAASGLVMTKTARVPAALVRGLHAAIGDASPGPARALVRARADDLFWESALIAASAAPASATFGPGEVPQDLVEEAVRATSRLPSAGGWTFVALTSTAARDRLLSVVGDAGDALRSAPMLIVPCIKVAGGRTSARRTEASILLAAGAAIRTLVIALHAQGLGSWWDPDLRLDADGARAALALDTDRRPIGIVAVGPIPVGGA
jgi:coenzyme F420-0:L-glutamate ligase / coenzyme F420-1:gamma-L-glutamate ligase